MNIEKLYRSGDFTLYDMEITGKKDTVSTLYFKGNTDRCTHVNEIRAVESGVVMFAGREYDAHRRSSKLRTHVNIAGENGVTITYAHLVQLSVREGDYVKEGEVIGYTDSSLKMLVQCRRNGRYIDACVYFKIKRKHMHFDFKDKTDRDIVCERCDLTDAMSKYIDGYFNADRLWERLARGICSYGLDKEV